MKPSKNEGAFVTVVRVGLNHWTNMLKCQLLRRGLVLGMVAMTMLVVVSMNQNNIRGGGN